MGPSPNVRLLLFFVNSLMVFIVSLDNYLAGHTKKSLRIGAKHVTDLRAFVTDLPVELQLLVRTTHETFNIIITYRQVLEYLHPIDLYHFSQISRYFRQLVLDPAVLPVWKAAFMRHPDLPTPPPGVKEPQWAFMIFGPAICSVCLCDCACPSILLTSCGTGVREIWCHNRF